MDVELSSCCDVKAAVFIVDTLLDIVDMIMYFWHLVKALFCSRQVNCLDIDNMYVMYVKGKETCIKSEFKYCYCDSSIAKLYNRRLSLPSLLSVVSVDT